MTSAPLTDAELDALVGVARWSVHVAIADGQVWVPDPMEYHASLREPRAAFVTLRAGGELRGCIGTLAATSPLVVTVADRARAAALDDPRFRPVAPAELPALEVSVSVLSTPMPMDVGTYAELLDAVRPGVDGLLVECVGHRATLLPSVWDQLAEPAQFVGALWRKAGLEPGAWPDGLHVRRYTAQHAG